MTDQLPTDSTPQQPVTSTASTQVEEKKYVFSLHETLLIVLIVVALIHFGLQPKSKPVKVQEPAKVSTVTKGPKAVIKVTPAPVVTPKSKAEIKTDNKHKRNDHSFSGPMGH